MLPMPMPMPMPARRDRLERAAGLRDARGARRRAHRKNPGDAGVLSGSASEGADQKSVQPNALIELLAASLAATQA